MTEIKNILINLCSPVNESTMIQYFPILKYTGLDLESTLVLSYVLGWNISGKVCYISKERIGNTFQIAKEDIEQIVTALVDNDFLIVKEVTYKKSKSKSFKANLDKIANDILENPEYKKIKTIQDLNNKIKQVEEGIIPEDKEDNQLEELNKLLEATRKKVK